jgi:dinuclear metal center YbgI/SA1388 family protein
MNVTIKDIASVLERWAPLAWQESYDNCGLLVGDAGRKVSKVLITLDVTEKVIEEAIKTGSELIVAHHPLIFNKLKRVTNAHWVERCVTRAIKHDIAIYAIHTNLDHVHTGVNRKICEKIGLVNTRVLSPKTDTLTKLVTFVPTANKQAVLGALYAAGAGHIGEYDHCSFQTEGTGTFRPSASARPAIGQQGVDESVAETRLEVLVPAHLQGQMVQALKQAHPYEEVAYYLSDLKNPNQEAGAGMIGELPVPMHADAFIDELKHRMNLTMIRMTTLSSQTITKVAVCGGSGSFLLPKAIAQGADIFISADFKYHDFFEADGRITIADIGHYESEVFTKDLLFDFLSENFTNIAVRLSGVVTNPVIYT